MKFVDRMLYVDILDRTSVQLALNKLNEIMGKKVEGVAFVDHTKPGLDKNAIFSTLNSKALMAESKALGETHWDCHTGELIEKTILAFANENKDRCYVKGPLLSALRYIAISYWEHGAKHMIERILEITGKKE